MGQCRRSAESGVDGGVGRGVAWGRRGRSGLGHTPEAFTARVVGSVGVWRGSGENGGGGGGGEGLGTHWKALNFEYPENTCKAAK